MTDLPEWASIMCGAHYRRSPEVPGRQAAKQITIPPGMGGRNVKR